MEPPRIDWNIVCFAGVDWDSHRQRPQWVMASFAERGAHVLYVDNLGTRLPRLADAGRVAHRLSRWLASSRAPGAEVGPGIRRDAPVVLPLQHLAAVRGLGRRTLVSRLRRRVGSGRPLVVWTYLPLPVIADAADDLGADLLVYDWSDDASEHVLTRSDAQRRRIGEWENRMVERADVVFVASAELLRRRGSANPRTHVVPHGVPPRPARAAHVPDAVASLPRPRVGFVGSISEWTDLELVGGLAEARPDWSFVMVGPMKARMDRLRGKANVVLVGERPHDEIPGYLAAFDAAIIPYRVTPATEAASPVKLREYLAQGLPVVSVDVPEVRPFVPPVELAAGVDGFVAALDRAIARGRDRPAGDATSAWGSRVDEMIARASEALAASTR